MCDAPTTRTQRRDSHVVLSDCNGTDSGLSATKKKVDPVNVPSTVAGEFGGQSVRRQVWSRKRGFSANGPAGLWRMYSGGVQRTDPVHPDALHSPAVLLVGLVGGTEGGRKLENGNSKMPSKKILGKTTEYGIRSSAPATPYVASAAPMTSDGMLGTSNRANGGSSAVARQPVSYHGHGSTVQYM